MIRIEFIIHPFTQNKSESNTVTQYFLSRGLPSSYSEDPSMIAQARIIDDEAEVPAFTAKVIVPSKLQDKAGDLEALIDEGTGRNYISAVKVAQLGYEINEVSTGKIRYPDGTIGPKYGHIRVPILVEDSLGERRCQADTYLNVVKLVGYDVLLGRSWTRDVDPSLHRAESKWSYPVERDSEAPRCKVKPVSPRRFEKISRGETIYYLSVTDCSAERDVPMIAAMSSEGLPQAYRQYEDVFSESEASKLPEHAEHEIPIEPAKKVPWGPLYNLSGRELQLLREYLETMQTKGWIRTSASPAGAPILFVPKADGTLRLCVDYRGLNAVTVKNRYPLPRIDEMLDRLVGAKIYTKLDLRDAYHRIRIKRGDEWKTAFRTRYGHFEYLVMPFGLCNAPASFQAYINQTLAGLLDITCIVYLDDILIFSQNEDAHKEHVAQVLERLRGAKLYAKTSKCEFHRPSVKFLGYIIDAVGVSMDPERISTIEEWPEPKTYTEIQVFLGFCGFFRRFIWKYSDLTAPMTDLLKGMQKGRKLGQVELTGEAKRSFQSLKERFRSTPVLQHFDPNLRIILRTDASKFALAGILMQPEVLETGKSTWHPVAFLSRKLTGAERNYDVHDKELLAVVECFKVWRHYLEGSYIPITVQTDHANLEYFFRTTKLNARQARWAERLAAFDFRMEYKPGKANPADAPSRRPDYMPLENAEEIDDTGMLPSLKKKLELASESGYHQEHPAFASRRTDVIAALEEENGILEGDENGEGHEEFHNLLRRSQQRDAEMAKHFKDEQATPRRVDLRDGVLYRNGKIWVPQDPTI